MVSIKEIREAIIRLPVDELKVYLEETIWDGIEEDSPEEDELDKIREEAMEPFIMGYNDLELRPGYHKLTKIAGCEYKLFGNLTYKGN